MTEAEAETAALEADIARLRGSTDELRSQVQESFLGQREVVDMLLLSLLARGHVLLEGAPGLGKTTLVKGLASALDLSFRRIQFTPDLMPADILGTRILEETPEGGHSFRFERGPLFAHLVLADEINRATPRTQSALLEAMEERQVTVFGETLALPEPFGVVATQNPIEMEGTYPLPEAQLDRFIAKIEIGAPDEAELARILAATTGSGPPQPRTVLRAEDAVELAALVRQIPASSDIVRLVARMIRATDPAAESAPESVRTLLRYGASPRGGQACILLAKARALILGRPWVAAEDIELVAPSALRHRLVYGYEGEASGVHPDTLVQDAWAAAQRG